jgi:hypothetical protein
MEATDIAAAFSRLETHAAWSSRLAYLQDAYNASPTELSKKSPLDDVRRQVAYLEARDAEDAARMALIAEVAAQGEAFLSLPYLLGSVAALSVTRSPGLTKRLSNRSFIFAEDLFGDIPGLGDVPAEQVVRPSKDPAERALQIGDEIVRLKGIFAVRGTVPVAMVWHYNYNPPRRSYSEVVTGNIPAARAFVLRKPKVKADKVDHGIPTRLTGIEKDEVVTKNEYVQPEVKYQDVPITSLTRLVEKRAHRGVDDPNAVYVGKEDVAQRVKRAKADNKVAAAEREAWQERYRRMHARRRYR